MDYKREYERLQQEIDDQRYEDERRREKEFRERENNREQARRDYQESLCYAEDWNDAFSKGLIKYSQEAREEQRAENQYPGEPEFEDRFFREMVIEVERASEVYQEEMKKVEENIRLIRERAEQEIAAVEQQAREKAAARLDELFPNSTTAQALRENNPNYLTDW